MKKKFKWWMVPLAIILSPILLTLCLIACLVMLPVSLATNFFCSMFKIECPNWADFGGNDDYC